MTVYFNWGVFDSIFLWQIISIDKWLTYNKLLAITYPVISQIYYDNGAFIYTDWANTLLLTQQLLIQMSNDKKMSSKNR